MKDSEILELRNVLLVPDTIEEAKRVVQLLWSNLLNSPWEEDQLAHLEQRYNYYQSKQDNLVIEISNAGNCDLSSLQWYKNKPYFKELTVIYLMSKKTMESRNVSVTIEQAKEWYNSNNDTLKTLALNVYTQSELDDENWTNIYNTVDKSCILELHASRDTNRFRALHKLSIIAAYFNKDWKMKVGKKGYFISPESLIRFDKIETTIAVFKHTSVMYPGLIYFENEEHAKKAIKLLGEDIKNLF